VGFDLYVRMVGEALAEAKAGGSDEGAPEVSATRIELPLDAHIPHAYVPDERLRLEAYRRLAEAGDPAAVAEVEAELVDRYGRMPEQVVALAQTARLRQRLASLGVTDVVMAGGRIRVEGLALPDSMQLRLGRLYPSSTLKPASRTILLPAPKTARLGGRPLTGSALIEWLDGFVDAVGAPVSASRS
jgi:transcription-repair coupling factor (superfamily II helicase)